MRRNLLQEWESLEDEEVEVVIPVEDLLIAHTVPLVVVIHHIQAAVTEVVILKRITLQLSRRHSNRPPPKKDLACQFASTKTLFWWTKLSWMTYCLEFH